MPEKVMLNQVMHHGGFKVLIRIFDAACSVATNDALRLDPEEPTYDHKLAVRTQRARNFAECIDLVNKSALFHTNMLKAEESQEEHEAVDAVRKVYGINVLPPKKGVIK